MSLNPQEPSRADPRHGRHEARTTPNPAAMPPFSAASGHGRGANAASHASEPPRYGAEGEVIWLPADDQPESPASAPWAASPPAASWSIPASAPMPPAPPPVAAPPVAMPPLVVEPEHQFIAETPPDIVADGSGQGGLLAYLRESPPWLISMIFHMVALIALGLFAFAVEHQALLVLEATMADEDDRLADSEAFEVGPTESEFDEALLAPQIMDELSEAPATMSIEAIPLMLPDKVGTEGLPAGAKPGTPGAGLSGRGKASKAQLLAAHGGDATTENAVQEGLAWLARHQSADGSWRLNGPFADGAGAEDREAATAMALLAFQGAGYTHQGDDEPNASVKDKQYARVVDRGWKYLLTRQNRAGSFIGRTTGYSHQHYAQAQCTIALCELYGMTRDPKLKQPAERAIRYAIVAQDPRLGGWRYSPAKESDLSVTGWFLMALQSARMSYLQVPQKSLDEVSKFLDRVQVDGGRRYQYMVNHAPAPAMDAEGLLCRQYLGWDHDDPRLVEGTALLTHNLINWNERDAYYWYYATQVCHHMGGEAWELWNQRMKQVLPMQQTREGAERGSWPPKGDRWGQQGGRLYVTCMHLYMLEVYYRHLPIYQQHAVTEAQ